VNDLTYAIRRLRWIGLILLAAVAYIAFSGSELLRSQLGVACWKTFLVTWAIVLADMTRRHLFPWLDLSEQVAENSLNAGRLFVGICLLYAAIIYSLTAGL